MAKKKITKEELKKLLAYRKRLITMRRKAFAEVSKDALREYDEFSPCEKCKFLCKNCQKSCGIIMKQLYKAGKIKINHTAGNGRIVSESEWLDTSSVNLGLSEEVDKSIEDEMNGNDTDVMFNAIEDNYDVED